MPELIKKGGLKKVLFRRSSCFHAGLASMWSLWQEMSTKLQHGQPVKPPPLRQRLSVKNQAKALARDSQQAARCRSGLSRKTLFHAVTLHNHKQTERMRPAFMSNCFEIQNRWKWKSVFYPAEINISFFSLSESKIITNKHTFSSFRVAVQMLVALKTLWRKI